jgi:hypothetical protein
MKTMRTSRLGPTIKPPPTENLSPIIEAVTRRAEQQGHILARQVREELTRAQADPRLWRQVLRAAGPALERRGGHYYFVPALSPMRQRQQLLHERIRSTVHELVQAYRLAVNELDRRDSDRVAFLQPVVVQTAAGEHHVLTKDISYSGIRLLGSRDLLGQKIRVTVPRPEGNACVFIVRIVWTCRVGDELYENGGGFLDLEE